MKKYGRTFHLPISPGASSDDKVMPSLEGLMSEDLVVTEKMDGENTTIHAGGSHARSPDSRYHPSRDWLKAFAAGISPQLSEGERIVGENLYARHSVAYDALPSYFLGFAWIIHGEVQSWDTTLGRFDESSNRGRNCKHFLCASRRVDGRRLIGRWSCEAVALGLSRARRWYVCRVQGRLRGRHAGRSPHDGSPQRSLPMLGTHSAVELVQHIKRNGSTYVPAGTS